jgi:beta-glucosidase
MEERAKKLVSQMTPEEKISQMLYQSPAIPRLGIPAYNWWNEALHGVARSGQATVFPQAIAMAASFDAPLLQQVGDAISDEVRAKYNGYKSFGKTKIYQGLTCWSPNINIFRDPRWGRGQETYGEDPYLTGVMASAFVNGLQGNHPLYRKVDATLKHYAVHSGPEPLRHSFDAVVSEEDLYTTYLWAFRYCLEHSHPAAVMGAYNRTNGVPCCASKRLLQDILRDEFGFDGYVVSDCGAISDINERHRYTENKKQSAALAVNAGCDLNCGGAYAALSQALQEGLITEERLTKAVERLFTARFRLGMFDSDCPYDQIGYETIESPKHLALCRKMAEESIVLLKNDGILPLKPETKLAVIGPAADNLDVLLGNYNGTPTSPITLLQGILAKSKGQVLYAKGSTHTHLTDENPIEEAILAARHSDIVILCMGLTPRMEGEEGDAGDGDKKDLELPQAQKELYQAILAEGKPIVFVHVSGSCLNLTDQDQNCSALIQCFYPGAEGGHALASILFGEVSPCGRLPVTFYRSADDLPPFTDYSMENRTYRYFKGEPLYPFGYGLTYSDIVETWKDSQTVEVWNRGNRDTGYSVLRFSEPPDRHLIGFYHLFLQAGERQTIVF